MEAVVFLFVYYLFSLFLGPLTRSYFGIEIVFLAKGRVF